MYFSWFYGVLKVSLLVKVTIQEWLALKRYLKPLSCSYISSMFGILLWGKQRFIKSNKWLNYMILLSIGKWLLSKVYFVAPFYVCYFSRSDVRNIKLWVWFLLTWKYCTFLSCGCKSFASIEFSSENMRAIAPTLTPPLFSKVFWETNLSNSQ